MPTTETSDYRLAGPLAVRLSGLLLVLIGTVVAGTVMLAAVLSWPRAVVPTLLVGCAGLLVVGGLLLTRRTTVVHLDAHGYRVRLVRGAGVKRGRWKDVEDVVATTVAGSRCVVLRLRDGRSTTIPVDVLDVPHAAFVQDLRQHLNRGHGYRPIG